MGRPKSESPKVNQTFRLSRRALDALQIRAATEGKSTTRALEELLLNWDADIQEEEEVGAPHHRYVASDPSPGTPPSTFDLSSEACRALASIVEIEGRAPDKMIEWLLIEYAEGLSAP